MGTTREWLLFLHIASVVVAFAPMVAHALVLRFAAEEGPITVQRWAGFTARYDQRIYGHALGLAGLFGMALVLTQDHWKFGDSWIASAFLLWIAMNGVLHGLIVPAETKMAAGDLKEERKLRLGGVLMTLLFISMLHLMIVKPGL